MLTPALSTPSAPCALCHLRSRRTFTTLLGLGAAAAAAGPGAALAQASEGLQGDVGRNSRLSKLVPADWLEGQAAQQYQGMMRNASQQRVLADGQDAQTLRLRHLARRIVPFAAAWNPRAPRWAWEVNLINQPTLNAFCMPGGKIAFYRGILHKLQLSDDEVAAIMGHEVAHALREHARERMAKTVATQTGLGVAADLLGLGGLTRSALNASGQLLSLKFSRDDETEADLVGMDLAARAGYDPAAGVTLWQKMMGVSKGAPSSFLSTHPAGATRIKDIQGKLPKVQPLFQRAARPEQRFGPPKT